MGEGREHLLRIGIAGIGNEGLSIVPFCDAVDGVELTAVADLRRDALDAFRGSHPTVQTFESVEAMCAGGAVDAVWIATPNAAHAENCLAAAGHGVNVILEKPMAITIEEADRIVDAVQRSGIRLLLHSHASDAPIVKMREIVASGRLGRLIGIHTMSYKGWLRSPRLAAELDTARGGGVVFRQGPHQIEIVRRLGGGLVKSVRAYTGRWHPSFDTEGNYTALLEFADGTPATLVFYGYGYFNVTDLTWNVGESGRRGSGVYRKQTRRTEALDAPDYYAQGRNEARGDDPSRERAELRQPIYGLTIVSCKYGEMRQSPDGIYVYTDDGCEEIICPPYLDRAYELQTMRDALAEDRSVFPDAPWSRATLEVILAILQSSREGREIPLRHQVSDHG
ncbi:MAG: Gfo/Idh/MocA family oxidoreductase [Chloroflexi bacterium]|nr:Gfo/Idh/MocA family oxidoreductase [Chloroflexota bacterium]